MTIQRSFSSRPLVLVVDDDPRHGQLLSLLEENLQIRVFNVHSSSEALNAVESNNFDLVLMDYQMPDVDGLECTRCLKEIFAESNKQLPIIGVTAHASNDVKRKCLDSGMQDFLPKPFTIVALQAVLNKHLDRLQ